jgi:hypothetical protein
MMFRDPTRTALVRSRTLKFERGGQRRFGVGNDTDIGAQVLADCFFVWLNLNERLPGFGNRKTGGSLLIQATADNDDEIRFVRD